MKVLTAAQMREIDRKTIAAGISSLILMENAAHRVVEFLAERFAPLRNQRIVVFCGKGNNGGDGMAIGRILHSVVKPRSLHVLLTGDVAELKGDAAENHCMLLAAGCPVYNQITPEMRQATLIVDAILGTGLSGPARGAAVDWIREINTGFSLAPIVAVDLPSGMDSDNPRPSGEVARADATVTFTAPKISHALAPSCDSIGELRIASIGTPPSFYEDDSSIFLSLSEPALFRHLFRPRPKESNKGAYGHALLVAGARGKSGAAALAGLAALRSGAGLVTVATPASALQSIAAHSADLMTEPLPETASGSVSLEAFEQKTLDTVLIRKNVVAAGPGLGTHPETVQFVRRLVKQTTLPMILDADALNAIAGCDIPTPAPRILTPHPGEMARLCGSSVEEVQANRVETGRNFAQKHQVWLVLKGNRSLICAPDGRVWINPTGSPALSKGGSGDILTGIITGLLAQFPDDIQSVVLAAVWLHGRAGELAGNQLGEKSVLADDLLQFLPQSIHEHSDLSDAV